MSVVIGQGITIGFAWFYDTQLKFQLCFSLKPPSKTQGQIVGPKTKIKTGGKKFDEQKYERKIRAPGDKLFTHQFQTAEDALKQVYVHISVEAGVKF